jgi:hypothetical protein
MCASLTNVFAQFLSPILAFDLISLIHSRRRDNLTNSVPDWCIYHLKLSRWHWSMKMMQQYPPKSPISSHEPSPSIARFPAYIRWVLVILTVVFGIVIKLDWHHSSLWRRSQSILSSIRNLIDATVYINHSNGTPILFIFTQTWFSQHAQLPTWHGCHWS